MMQYCTCRNSPFLFWSILLTLIAFNKGCTSDEYPIEDARIIVMDAADLFIKDKAFLCHKSMPKEQLMPYLEMPITFEHLNSLIDPPDDLDSLFNPGILEKFTDQVKNYQSIHFDDKLFEGIKTIRSSEIPDYIKDGFRPPAPDEDYTVSNVYSFASPLIYQDRAILLIRSYRSAGMTVYFYIKKDENWNRIASNGFYRPKKH